MRLTDADFDKLVNDLSSEEEEECVQFLLTIEGEEFDILEALDVYMGGSHGGVSVSRHEIVRRAVMIGLRSLHAAHDTIGRYGASR